MSNINPEELGIQARNLQSRVQSLMVANGVLDNIHPELLFVPVKGRNGIFANHYEAIASRAAKNVLIKTHRQPRGLIDDNDRRFIAARFLAKERSTLLDKQSLWLVEDVTVFDDGIAQYATFMVEGLERRKSTTPILNFFPGICLDLSGHDTIPPHNADLPKGFDYPFGNYGFDGDLDGSRFAIEAAERILEETKNLRVSKVSSAT